MSKLEDLYQASVGTKVRWAADNIAVFDRLDEEEQRALASFLHQAIAEASAPTVDLYPDFDRYEQLYEGRHFKSPIHPEDQRKPNPSEQPSAVVLNETQNHIRYMTAWLTDRVPRFRVFPTSRNAVDKIVVIRNTGPVEMPASEVMRSCLISRYVVGRYREPITEAIRDSLIYGVGLLEAYWSSQDAQGLGDVALRRISPRDCFPGPGGSDIRDLSYFVIRRRMDPSQIETISGDRFVTLEHQHVSSNVAPAETVLYPSHASSYTGTSDPPFLYVFDFWVKKPVSTEGVESWAWYKFTVHFGLLPDDQRRLRAGQRVPTSRYVMRFLPPLTVYARLPFAKMTLLPTPTRRFVGQGFCELLYYPQRALNEMVTATKRQIEYTGNPIWKEEAGARKRGAKVDIRAGEVIPLNDGYFDKAGFVPPPPLNNMQMVLAEFMAQFFERVTGMSAVMRGLTPSPEMAVGAAQISSEASQVLVREMAARYEREVEHLFGAISDLIAHYYIAERTVPLVEDFSVDTYVGLPPRPFQTVEPDGTTAPMQFAVHFEAGSQMAVSRALRAATALQFFTATGGAPGIEWLGQELGIDGVAEVLQAARQSEEQRMQAYAQRFAKIAEKIRQAALAIGGPDAKGAAPKPRSEPPAEGDENTDRSIGLQLGQLPEELIVQLQGEQAGVQGELLEGQLGGGEGSAPVPTPSPQIPSP